MKYALVGIILAVAIAGSYWCGYVVGSSDVKVEYVTKEVEVVKYVEKKKAEIYSTPNARRDDIIRLFNAGKL